MNYQDINAKTIDSWANDGWEWGTPISHEAYLKARNGDWSMLLTPKRPVPPEWFPKLDGIKVLGLACGGGQQMPVFAALGAECTVLDYSEKQLEQDRMVARREGYAIEIVRADMTKPLPFSDNSFDLIFHPVANCYIEEVIPVWRECCRILKPGGRLLAGMDNGFNFVLDDDERTVIHSLPFNPLKDKKLFDMLQAEDSGVQFSHTLDEQIRGQIQAGLQLVDLYEDVGSEGASARLNIPAFWATYSIKEGKR